MEGFRQQGHSTGSQNNGENNDQDLVLALQRALAAEQIAAGGQHGGHITPSSSRQAANEEHESWYLRGALARMTGSGSGGGASRTTSIGIERLRLQQEVAAASMTAASSHPRHQLRHILATDNNDLMQPYLVQQALEQQSLERLALEEMLRFRAAAAVEQEQTLHLRAAAAASAASSASTDIGGNASLAAVLQLARHGTGAATATSQESLLMQNILAAAAAAASPDQIYNRDHAALNDAAAAARSIRMGGSSIRPMNHQHHGLDMLLGPASLNPLSRSGCNTNKDLTDSARMSTSLLAQQRYQLEQLERLKQQQLQQQQQHRLEQGLCPPQDSPASTTTTTNTTPAATVPFGLGHSPRARTAAVARLAAARASSTPRDDDENKKRPASMSGLTSRALAAAKRAVSGTSQNLKQCPPDTKEEEGTRKRPLSLVDDDDDNKSSSTSSSTSNVANDDNAQKIAAATPRQQQLTSNRLVSTSGRYNDGNNQRPAVPATATSGTADLALPLLPSLSSLSALWAYTHSLDGASLALLQKHLTRQQELQALQSQRQQLLASPPTGTSIDNLVGQSALSLSSHDPPLFAGHTFAAANAGALGMNHRHQADVAAPARARLAPASANAVVLPQASLLSGTLPHQLKNTPSAARATVASALKPSAGVAVVAAAASSSPASPPLDVPENSTMVFCQHQKLQKPQRPLSAYNLFFRDERAAMLRELADQEALLAAAEEEEVGGDNDEQRNPKRKKMKRKKTPTIGFAVLGQKIGQKWKTIDAARLNEYMTMAAEEKERYNRERDAYRAQQAQEAFALLEEGNDSSSNSDEAGASGE